MEKPYCKMLHYLYEHSLHFICLSYAVFFVVGVLYLKENREDSDRIYDIFCYRRNDINSADRVERINKRIIKRDKFVIGVFLAIELFATFIGLLIKYGPF